MWHAARKQEKKLRGLMVDYKKRAERRRGYYEMIKKDPCSYLRLNGTSVKINLDPHIAQAAESDRTMMAWSGDSDNMIDRFDVRSHLDYIPPKKKGNLPNALELEEDMKCNYERYRIVVQNDCAGIGEESALKQIDIDEKYGDITKHNDEEKKKSASSKKAAIGFSYDGDNSTGAERTGGKRDKQKAEEESESDNEDDYADVDLDIAFDIDQISGDLKQQLDIMATTYGMSVGEFTEQLRKDKQDEQELREARIAEEEKAALSGRKSRRERRTYKETMLRLRGASPPKYVAGGAPRDSPTYGSPTHPSDSDSSRSRSRDPPSREVTPEFITSFGADASGVERELPAILPSKSDVAQRQNQWKKMRERSDSPPFQRSKSQAKPATVDVNNANRLPALSSSASGSTIKYRRESSKSFSGSDSDTSDSKHTTSYRQRQHGNESSKGSSYSSTKSLVSSSYAGSVSKLTAQEKLARKMKAAINRTYKEDKKKELVKKEMAHQHQMEREEEMRGKAYEIRRREREREWEKSRSRSRTPDRGRTGPQSSYGGYTASRRSHSRSPQRRDRISYTSRSHRSRSRSRSRSWERDRNRVNGRSYRRSYR